MTSLNRQQQGFTIVELLIVIVVIGILAALVITTFTGIQQKGRNTKRQTDINAVHQSLEAYYAQNTRYPTVTELNTASFRKASLKGLDMDAFHDPKTQQNPTADSDGYKLYTVLAAPAANDYAYEPKDAAGGDCTNTGGDDCVSYTLTATNEGSGTYTKKSL